MKRVLAALEDWRLQLAVVVIVAASLRLIYLLQIRGWPFFFHPILDSRTQWKWAGILLSTHWRGNAEVLAKAPLYAYFLGLNQWALESRAHSLYSAYTLHLLMGAATCGLTYLIGRRVFGAAVGFLAGLLLALYSPGIYRDGQLLDTALATLLATGFLLLLLRAFAAPGNRAAWLAAGLGLGFLGLTRPNLLLLGVTTVVLVPIWLRRDLGWRRACVTVGILALGVVLPIIPITGRNYLIARRFIPISATGGINLYTGNNPSSDGYSPIPSGIAWERTWYEALSHGAMHATAQDAYWRRKALAFFRSEPRAALALLVKKAYLYWNAYEIPNNVSYEWGRDHSSLLRAVPLTLAVIGPLGLLGMVLGGWRSRGAWVLSLLVLTQMAAVILFFFSGRYRMPAVPALCVLAAFAVVGMLGMLRACRFGRAAASLALLVVFALFANSDAYGVRRERGGNRDWYYLGQSYVLAEDYERAKEAFKRAIHQDPEDADACALLGQVQVLTGEPEAAARSMRRALQLAPDFAMTATRLADLCLDQGWPLEEAERLLRRASDLQPRNVYGLAMLVRLSIRKGDLEQAKADLEAALTVATRMNPDDTRALPAMQAVVRAVSEARQAGVEIPPGF